MVRRGRRGKEVPFPIREEHVKSALVFLIALSVSATPACRTLDRSQYESPETAFATFDRPQLVLERSPLPEPPGYFRAFQPSSANDRHRSEWNEFHEMMHAETEPILRSNLDHIFSGEETNRRITVRYSVFARRDPAPLWSAMRGLSMVSLSTINLLGLPASHTLSDVTLEFFVEAEEVPRIRSVGTGSAYVAYWWGYDGTPSCLVASFEALRDALGELERSLTADPGLLMQSGTSEGE
jgi:hypothetical protein